MLLPWLCPFIAPTAAPSCWAVLAPTWIPGHPQCCSLCLSLSLFLFFKPVEFQCSTTLFAVGAGKDLFDVAWQLQRFGNSTFHVQIGSETWEPPATSRLHPPELCILAQLSTQTMLVNSERLTAIAGMWASRRLPVLPISGGRLPICVSESLARQAAGV